MKKFARKRCRKMLLEAIFFAFGKHFFQSFRSNFLSFLYMISLVYKIYHCLSANHNLELRYVIFTGVTLFAPVLHSNCTPLSQSESSNFFMCILKNLIHFLQTVDFQLKNIVINESKFSMLILWLQKIHLTNYLVAAYRRGCERGGAGYFLVIGVTFLQVN